MDAEQQIAQLERSLQQDPSSTEQVRQLVSLLVRVGRSEDARRRACALALTQGLTPPSMAILREARVQLFMDWYSGGHVLSTISDGRLISFRGFDPSRQLGITEGGINYKVYESRWVTAETPTRAPILFDLERGRVLELGLDRASEDRNNALFIHDGVLLHSGTRIDQGERFEYWLRDCDLKSERPSWQSLAGGGIDFMSENKVMVGKAVRFDGGWLAIRSFNNIKMLGLFRNGEWQHARLPTPGSPRSLVVSGGRIYVLSLQLYQPSLLEAYELGSTTPLFVIRGGEGEHWTDLRPWGRGLLLMKQMNGVALIDPDEAIAAQRSTPDAPLDARFVRDLEGMQGPVAFMEPIENEQSIALFSQDAMFGAPPVVARRPLLR